MKWTSVPAVGDGAHVVANLPYNVGTALLLQMAGRSIGRHGGDR